MKVLSNGKRISAHKNGDLVPGIRNTTRKIASGGSSEEGEPKVIGISELRNHYALRCVLGDKTNVKSTIYTPIGHQKTQNKSHSVTCYLTPRKNSCDSNSFQRMQRNDIMKKSETSQNERNEDVYEFVLEEGEVNENKPKGKSKKTGNKRKCVQRKIIDSPEEVLPAKKIRKPLQDKVSENFMSESLLRKKLGNKELGHSATKPCSVVISPYKTKLKAVHFSSLSHDQGLKLKSEMRMQPSTPKHVAKSVSSPAHLQVLKTPIETCGKVGTPNLSTLLQPSLRANSVRSCAIGVNEMVSSHSVSEGDRLDLRTKGNEVSRQLLSFFSPVHKGNSQNSGAILVAEKTPAKQLTGCSFRTDTENIEIGQSESVQTSLPYVTVEQHSSKIQKNLDVSNYFGFDEDTESDDEDFSPVRTLTKSSHKLGKFQCSTPKAVGQKNGVSQPFRFPALSIVKRVKFPKIIGNTTPSLTDHCRKTAYENSSGTLARKPCSPNSSVKEQPMPAIFDLEDEGPESQNDKKYDGEHQQLQVTLKDHEAISSPQKELVQKCYGTPKHMTRLRRPVLDVLKEDFSEDDTEESQPKRHRKPHRAPKKNEAEEWAKSFNSMCETIDSFELIVE